MLWYYHIHKGYQKIVRLAISLEDRGVGTGPRQ